MEGTASFTFTPISTSPRMFTIPTTAHQYSDLRRRFQQNTSDVVFKGESGNELHAHKMVLSVASPVFFEMFQGDWKEKDQDKLPVPGGFQWEVFEAVISFLYDDEIVKIKEDQLLDLYKLAHYLQLQKLILAIAEGLKVWSPPGPGSREVGSWVFALCESVRSRDEGEGKDPKGNALYQACLTFFVKNIQFCSGAELSYATILDIVTSEEITGKEINILKFIAKYIEGQDLRMSEVDTLYNNVRFGTIPHCTLSEEVPSVKYASGGNLGRAVAQHSKFDLDVVLENIVLFQSRKAQKSPVNFFPMQVGMKICPKRQQTSKTTPRLGSSMFTSWGTIQASNLVCNKALVSNEVLVSNGNKIATVYSGYGEEDFRIQLRGICDSPFQITVEMAVLERNNAFLPSGTLAYPGNKTGIENLTAYQKISIIIPEMSTSVKKQVNDAIMQPQLHNCLFPVLAKSTESLFPNPTKPASQEPLNCSLKPEYLIVKLRPSSLSVQMRYCYDPRPTDAAVPVFSEATEYFFSSISADCTSKPAPVLVTAEWPETDHQVTLIS